MTVGTYQANRIATWWYAGCGWGGKKPRVREKTLGRASIHCTDGTFGILRFSQPLLPSSCERWGIPSPGTLNYSPLLWSDAQPQERPLSRLLSIINLYYSCNSKAVLSSLDRHVGLEASRRRGGWDAAKRHYVEQVAYLGSEVWFQDDGGRRYERSLEGFLASRPHHSCYKLTGRTYVTEILPSFTRSGTLFWWGCSS